MVISKLKATEKEADILIRASRGMTFNGETHFCPRCGKKLLVEEFGASYMVKCSDEKCISATMRGI